MDVKKLQEQAHIADVKANAAAKIADVKAAAADKIVDLKESAAEKVAQLKEKAGNSEIAEKVNLTGVTVRRYMNYLCEKMLYINL